MKVLVAGCHGKMGKMAVASLQDVGHQVIGVGSKDDLNKAIEENQPKVMVDLTTPNVVEANIKCALKHQLPIVVGTTGLDNHRIQALSKIAEKQGTGVIVAPNFSMGALLMMHCAQMAQHFYDAIDIVEVHHPEKKDQPSGTALRTAAMLDKPSTIHSRRQLGVLADQSVYFGGQGEIFSIKHHTSSRSCFMPGLMFAVNQVTSLNKLVYGLDQVLFPQGALKPEVAF